MTMLRDQSARTVWLGFGLQSGGTTLISYCFLQRQDMTGVLDWFHDRLPDAPPNTSDKYWCKSTIASFRAEETIAHFEDLGYRTRPLLVVRDVRQAFDSLIGKPYGRNATTAEDPPLRTRFRRFLSDWRHFTAQGLPVMTLESFIHAPEGELRRVCSAMGLDWDPAMVDWPKPPAAVWDGRGANQGFLEGVGADLVTSLRPGEVGRPLNKIGRADLDWLDAAFADYNAALGYPARLPAEQTGDLPTQALIPDIRQASRYPAMRWRERLYRAVPALRQIRRKLRQGSS